MKDGAAEGSEVVAPSVESLIQSISTPSPQSSPPINEEIADEADAPKGVAYTERVTAFVDILGFKEIVTKSALDGNDDLIGRIYSALDIGNDDLAKAYAAELNLNCEPDAFDDRFHTFSDCIIISVKPEPLEIGLLVYIIFKICRRLLQAGFISRGGVAMGKLYHRTAEDRSGGAPMVFGPAFLQAYALESTHAEGARVILQSSLVQRILSFKNLHERDPLTKFFTAHIKVAPDGPSFIDLFADFPGNCFYENSRDVAPEIEIIQDKLTTALRETSDKPTQFRKNAMLAREFNCALDAACTHTRSPALAKFKISSEVLPQAVHG